MARARVRSSGRDGPNPRKGERGASMVKRAKRPYLDKQLENIGRKKRIGEEKLVLSFSRK